jgi:S1-C subfamily serine protease
LVTTVERGSAAAEAGLRGASREIIVGNYSIPWGGDYVIQVDGRGVTQSRTLTQVLSLKHGGDTIRLKVIREGQEQDITVTLQSARRGSFRL